MKLHLDRLTASPEELHLELPPEWWQEHGAAEGEAVCATEPFYFDLRASCMGDEIHIEGALRSGVTAECSRCLARYGHALRDSFRLLLEPVGDRVPEDPEDARALARDGLWLGNELEAGWYQGSEIRLDALFAEVISLALPVQPLCRDDCRGLCPRCGADRNENACGCEPSRPESPFAVLEVLKRPQTQGES